MKNAPGESQDRPLVIGPKVAPPAPAPAPKVEHVRGSIYSVDGRLETRNYTPGSGK